MIFRVEKTKGFTVMSNYHLRDKNLSLKAKGLLSVMISLPDDWDYSIKGLKKLCKEGKNSIMRILQELESFNYLERKQTFDKKKRFKGCLYIIYEFPKIPCPYFEDTENPCPHFEDTENGDTNKLLNKVTTNKQSTNILSTDVDVGYQESHPVELGEQQQQPEDFIFVGTDKNVRVRKSFYETFKNTYSYYNLVFNALSEYKTKNHITAHVMDEKYLSEWAVTDKERFEYQFSKGSFDVDDFFEAALKHSYQRHNTEG
ncbi:MAG: helix-turn-helix domain-containing protein [Clostridia bacterium]|nr:helix-turn-helix domain-containing protein [Clostridia bacterium]